MVTAAPAGADEICMRILIDVARNVLRNSTPEARLGM